MELKVLVYATETERSAQLLQGMIEAIETQVPDVAEEACRTIDSFAERLRTPANRPRIAVLITASREELSEILSIKDLIHNLRIILILPDRKSDTIAQGHTLRPRFLTYADSDFSEVAAVLDKMLGNTWWIAE
ncbi:MAG: hypothetical protein HWN68_05340 [Desulfobacterales bacterium]|nr:hypothetical protein [Desulfobacterales bacterium]